MAFNNRIGFIGTGNLATALIEGSLKKGNIKPENIYIYDVSEEKVNYLSKYSVSPCKTACELAKIADYIFLTVKPGNYDAVLTEIAPFSKDKCLISVAAGITMDYVKSYYDSDIKIIRVMPNTPLLVGEGASALARGDSVTQEDFENIFNIFQNLGFAAEVPESQINTVTAVSGSAPAYLFRFAKLIIEFASRQGLSEDIALNLFAQTMKGSAKMLTETGDTPEELVKKVSSPGGTTIAALKKFDELGYDESISEGLLACMNRAFELGEK